MRVGSVVATTNIDSTYASLQVGPVATSVGVGNLFQSYKKGIFDGRCCASGINHAVVIVGFGVENAKEFWIIRNTWGATWGEEGHIRIALSTDPKADCFVPKYGFRVNINK